MCFLQKANVIRLVKAIGQTRCEVFHNVPLSSPVHHRLSRRLVLLLGDSIIYSEHLWTIAEFTLTFSQVKITPKKMHKKRVFCPYKRCHKVPPCHFDGMAFGLAFLTIGKLSPQGAWTFFSPLLVLSCWMSWSMTLPWMRTRSGFIFGGWFFFRWEKWLP